MQHGRQKTSETLFSSVLFETRTDVAREIMEK